MSGLFGIGLYGLGLYGFELPDPVIVDHITTVDAGGGIVLGGTDALGVTWDILRGSDAFGNAPAPRDVSGERFAGHGSWSATEYWSERIWNINLIVQASHDELHRAEHRLAAACGMRPFPIVCDEPFYGPRVAYFRRRGELQWTEDTPTMAHASMTLVADDPLIRGLEKTTSAPLPSTSGGLSWPTSWPATWDATVSSGLLDLTNDGNETASLRWRIDGPVTDPAIVNQTTGQTLRTDITLAAGEWLTIDTATRRVLANGDINATRRNRVYGDWWELPPGAIQARLSGSGAASTTELTATWQDSWI